MKTMIVREPKFRVGERVCCVLTDIRGHPLPKGTVGKVVDAPLRIGGGFAGWYHVKFRGVPGTAILCEGLLY